jgi:hypothetical protein
VRFATKQPSKIASTHAEFNPIRINQEWGIAPYFFGHFSKTLRHFSSPVWLPASNCAEGAQKAIGICRSAIGNLLILENHSWCGEATTQSVACRG